MATPTYDLLDSVTLSSSASSVTFSSIDQSYRDLVLIVEALGNASSAANVLVTFNSDSGSNYPYVGMSGNGSTAISFTGTSTSISGFGSDGTTRVLSSFQINDYSVTDKHKSVLVRANRPDSVVQARAARWANTSAITTVTITDNLANGYAAGSTFYLYGVAA